MAGKKNYRKRNGHQVVVNIPVIVEESREQKRRKAQWKQNRRLMTYLGSGILVVAILIIFIMLGSRPDMVLTSGQPRNPTPPLILPSMPVTQGSLLSDTYYENKALRFRLKSPAGWLVRGSGPSVVEFIDPDTSIQGSDTYATVVDFPLTISVSTQSAETRDLVMLAKGLRSGMLKRYADFTISDNNQVVLSGRPYYLIGGEYSVGVIRIKTKNLVTLFNETIFTISATGPVAAWDENEIAISASMASFEIF